MKRRFNTEIAEGAELTEKKERFLASLGMTVF